MEAGDWLKGGAQKIRRGCGFRARTSVLARQCGLLEFAEEIFGLLQGQFCDKSC